MERKLRAPKIAIQWAARNQDRAVDGPASPVNMAAGPLYSRASKQGYIVLEKFADKVYGTVAVLFRPDAANYKSQTGLGEPYVVAYGYDETTGEWSQGRYTSNLSYALDLADPEALEGITVRWIREDFAAALEGEGIDPTEKDVDALIDECGRLAAWRDRAIQDGNETIAGGVWNLVAARRSAVRGDDVG